ncbi:thioredoxin domain-containing protein [Pantanalinema sp. GBBB05]|uniref:thioredoxin domain-containing protein n=1 Tax=Pantanalinema sp. GBBB05 TaxID=2604139 RepID=UPI001DDCFD3A|nr:thioredoxin domain-containing protein [Pantanalinema sp. GBBB05]
MPNRLATAKSLYLRKHAENPIAWWDWSEEALATAQRDNKPIFLSVGYSSCHWCTVMEGEAFSDPTIAEYMNANFLPIKVDREERPDLDSIYMQALQMMVGQGGWPLNIFLTPGDLVPFYGGTYFPVEPRYGRPGFLQVLQAVRRYYDTETDKLQAIKTEILSNLQGVATLQPAAQIGQDVLRQGLEYNTGVVSGSSPGPSFPMIPYADVALRTMRFRFDCRYDAKATSNQRGLDLALGGIFDHVGGGFHRYTVDSTWTVPHFEKMLYDNGQITEYLANLWVSGLREPAFERAIDLTVSWLKREMTAPTGYFYAAQDADTFLTPEAVEPEEGAFYVWSYSELQQLLSPQELAELARYFTVSANGNFEGKNVLQRRTSEAIASTAVTTSLVKLFEARYGQATKNTVSPARTSQEAKTGNWSGRIPPVTDTKMIVAWNSLMISGLARAASALQRSDYLQLATQAAQFILEHQWVKHRLHRLNYDGQVSILAQSEDYALLIKALLDLHQTCLGFAASAQEMVAIAQSWLDQAIRAQEEFDEFLWSLELGGYYNTDASDDLLVRERSYIDNATPAANGVAAANLIRLALLTADLSYFDRAEQTLRAFATVMEQSPQACPSLFSALDWWQHHTLIQTTSPTIATLATHYLPTAVYQLATELPNGVVGLVCQGLSCQEPARSLEQVLTQVQASQTRG